MSEEQYADLCSTPRNYGDEVPHPDEPQFSHDLALIFSEAMIKVSDAVKRKKSTKADLELIKKFKGQFPPTIKAILNGEKLNDDAGWNQIAMQVAIVGNALGKSHDEVVEQARQLIDTHAGDSGRYGNPTLRERELRAQLAYTLDNPCYVYSVGAVKKLLAEGESAPDLAGITSEKAAADYASTKATIEADEDDDDDFTGGVILGASGIRQRSAEGEMKVLSRVGFDKVTKILSVDASQPAGFEVDVYYRNKRVIRTMLTLDSLSSRSKLNAFCAQMTGGTFQGSDSAASYVQELLMLKARNREDGGGEEFLIRREGIDVINFPANVDVPEVARKPFPVLGSPVGCAVPQEISDAGLKFRFMGDPNPAGYYKTDVMMAPALENTDLVREVLTSMMAMNRDMTIAPILGWMCAAHARMFYHLHRRQFPLLAISGQAGAGKTTTTKEFLHLHYFKREPQQLQAGGSSVYGITSAIQSSTSIPAYIDEYKPRELPAGRQGLLLSIFRACYDNGTFTKGGANQSLMSSGREVVENSYSAPTLFLGEAVETQTAIVERSVRVQFDVGGIYGRDRELTFVQDNHHVLSSVGRQLAWLLLGVDFDRFCESFDKDHEEVKKKIGNGSNYRIVYNYGVALHGLTLFSNVLQTVGIDLDSRIADLRNALLIPETGKDYKAKSEAAKVMSSLALMSLMDGEPENVRLFVNKDYTFSESGGIDLLEISLPFAFVKYEEWCKRKGRTPLYDNQDAFMLAMKNFRPYFDSGAKRLDAAPGVVRFRIDQLEEEGVDMFKRK